MNEFAHLREGGHVASSGGGVGDGLKGPLPGAGVGVGVVVSLVGWGPVVARLSQPGLSR